MICPAVGLQLVLNRLAIEMSIAMRATTLALLKVLVIPAIAVRSDGMVILGEKCDQLATVFNSRSLRYLN